MIDGDAIVYESRAFGLPKVFGLPILGDFGEARDGRKDHDADIQPEMYRAPEVILEHNWTYSVDIWNLGVMVVPPPPSPPPRIRATLELFANQGY